MLVLAKPILVAALIFLLSSPCDAAPPPKTSPEDLQRWIRDLGDEQFEVRQRASAKLIAAGQPTAATLEKAAKGKPAEVRQRIKKILNVFRSQELELRREADLETWVEEEVPLKKHIDQYRGPYSFQIKDLPRKYPPTQISILGGERTLHSWMGHAESSFVFVNHDVVIYKLHLGATTGCSLAAFDLRKKAKLWEVKLKGIGQIRHFKYRNQVVLRYGGDEHVTVYGKETAGSYVEQIDIKTGKTAGHRRVR